MHIVPPISRSLDELLLAEGILGRDDPLVAALDRQVVAVAQLYAAIRC